jgi:hypothetical protein
MTRRKEEEIWQQNTVTEYVKFYKYTKNLTKEYQRRNLKVLDVNGQLLSEKIKVMDGKNIFKEIKWSGSIKHRIYMEEADFNVIN